MNNPLQIFLNQMIGNSQIMNNPMIKNAMEMYQNGDSDGLNKLAQNMCKEKGTTIDEMKNQIMKHFGM